MIKRFLVPVLALAAFGLPAMADVVTYCDGGGCSSNTTAAFNSLVTLDALTYANATDLTFTGSLTGTTQYTDGLTSMVFADSDGFNITGSSSLEAKGGSDTITVTVPSQYSVVQLSLVASTSGFWFTCLDAGCNTTTNLTTTPQFVDYVDTTPGTPWTITFSSGSANKLIIAAFDPAGVASQGGGGGGSSTPEVGTLLLIGTGLIAMRWMKRVPRRFFRTPQTA
jgi:hypothetical protein